MKNLLFFLTIFMLILSCSISEPEEVLINKPTIVITFDDQHDCVYENALPIFKNLAAEFGYSIPACNIINTDLIGKAGKLNWEQVEELEFQYDWETCGHTLHHVNLPDCTPEEAEFEIYQDWLNLKNRNLSHETFALPSGHASEQQIDIISRYYKNIRNSRDIKMYDPLDRKNLGYFFYSTEYNAEDVINRIESGIFFGEDLIIIGFHRVRNETNGFVDVCKLDDFEQILRYLYSKEFEVVRIRDLF